MIPARIQGPLLRELAGQRPTLPEGRPHRWQNFAPGESWAPQPAQGAEPSWAPQLEQNLPLAGTPQVGQGVVSIGPGK